VPGPAAAAPIPITDIVTVLVTVGTMAIGFALKWLNDKRKSSGTVETSAADTLWAQTQAFTKMLMEEKQHAEGQRDRLIESQAGQVAPALEALNKSMAVVIAALQENTTVLAEVREYLGQGRQHAPEPTRPANPDG
jgi:hypothetical protein